MATKTTANDYVTYRQLESFGDKLRKDIVDDMSQVVAELAKNMHSELIEIKTEIAEVRSSLDRLTNTIDGFIKRLDDIETDNTARDAQLARLERWIEQVAKKTGVKLEY